MVTTLETNVLIHELMRKCLDACKRLEAAASIVLDPTIKNELTGYSAEQQRFARDLNCRLAACGNAPDANVSSENPIPCYTTDLLTVATTSDGHPVFAACEQGEHSAVDTYRRALGADVPEDCTQLIETQYEAIQHAHSRIKVLHHDREQLGNLDLTLS